MSDVEKPPESVPPPVETPPPAPPAEPPAPADAPAVPADAPDPDAVPYPVFRQARTEATRFRRELDGIRPELDQLRGRASTLEQQLQQTAAEREEYRSVVEALREHPDLFEEYKTRLGGGAASGASAAVPHRPPTTASQPIAGIDRDTIADIRTAAQFARSYQEREYAANEQARLQGLANRVQGTIASLLKKAGTPDEGLKDATTLALDFVIMEGRRRFGDEANEADVPFLTREYLNRRARASQADSSDRIRSHQQAAGLPPPVPTGGAPHVSPRSPRLDSQEIRDQALHFLERAGW